MYEWSISAEQQAVNDEYQKSKYIDEIIDKYLEWLMKQMKWCGISYCL